MFKRFLKMLGWIDYREHYESQRELLLERVYECDTLKQVAQSRFSENDKLNMQLNKLRMANNDLQKENHELSEQSAAAIKELQKVNHDLQRKLMQERQQKSIFMDTVIKSFPDEWEDRIQNDIANRRIL